MVSALSTLYTGVHKYIYKHQHTFYQNSCVKYIQGCTLGLVLNFPNAKILTISLLFKLKSTFYK